MPPGRDRSFSQQIIDMDSVLIDLLNDFDRNADVSVRIQGEKFFKENVRIRGLRNALTTSIGRDHYKKLPDKSKERIFELCDQLWQTGYMEDSFIACNWSYNVRKQYIPSDFLRFEHWVENYLSNWASCDTLCNHTIGTFIEMYPSYLKELKRWTRSGNRWVKRASAVSLIIPAKKGLFLKDVFEIAGSLHSDRDDMVQKGYGWMLKVASQAHQDEVFNYVMERKKTMPRTALRYAIEKMPADLKARAMAK